MFKYRLIAIGLILLAAGLGWFNYASQTATEGFLARFPFKLGLDLSGGTHLIYQADTSALPEAEVNSAMEALRDVIERRVNLFGVSEPVVQVSRGRDNRLVVELPGVTDLDQAIALIGATPVLEFKTEGPAEAREAFQKKLEEVQNKGEAATVEDQIELAELLDQVYLPTALTGRLLKKASLQFESNTSRPIVVLEFNDEGKELFAEITKNNVGKTVAIFLDGAPISNPVVEEEITAGRAQISGDFDPLEAKLLVGRLNSGALPVPIELLSSQKIGASLGDLALSQGIVAGLYGFLAVALFLLIWYRLPGLVAVLALALYGILVLAIFKLVPVTLTAAGIAGFILSLGMAVDANILIFERFKEERRKGLSLEAATAEGFSRAWPSIRDSNISSMITAVVLFWLGTSLIKGFALTFGIGVLVSMFSAITVSRTFLLAAGFKDSPLVQRLFSSGLTK